KMAAGGAIGVPRPPRHPRDRLRGNWKARPRAGVFKASRRWASLVGRPLILDTSALLAGRPLGPGEDTVVPSAVLAELSPGGRDRRHLDNLLAAGARLVEAAPADQARVREEAKKGGEIGRLTSADVDVLAVAL